MSNFHDYPTGGVAVPSHIVADHRDAYASTVRGDTLAPEIRDGDHVIAAPTATPVPGQFVALYLRGSSAPIFRRLVSAPPADPTAVLTYSGPEPFVVEELEPARRSEIPAAHVCAAHGVLHIVRRHTAPPDAGDLGRLSFVGNRSDGLVFDVWAVTPSGDYAKDYQRGEDIALELLAWARDLSLAQPGERPRLGILPSVAIAQGLAYSEDQRGLLVGFWSVIGSACAPAIDCPGFVDATRDSILHRRETDARWQEERQQQRSEQARRAAQARWAKHRACVAVE